MATIFTNYTSAAHTSAGAILSICATLPATYDNTGFSALTWVPVHEISDMGELGMEFKEVNHLSLDTRNTTKFKGSYDAGTMQLTLAKVETDPGQALFLTALNSDSDYAFSIYFPQTANNIYVTGKVMSYKTKVGNVDSMLTATCKLALTNYIVEH